MTERDLLARRFEAHRSHLRGVAFRMLGSSPDADDALQEAWLRVSRDGADGVDNLGGWLTTVVARVCLDMLRARRSRREEALGAHEPRPTPAAGHEHSPEADVQLADSVGIALLIVLERLGPAERVAFVLHDMFDLSFEEIAPVVGRTPVATRQLASRARRRVRGASISDVDRARQRAVVEAFLAASKAGDLEALVALLDPEVVLRSDAQGIRMGGPAELRGAAAVAERFKGRAQAAVAGLIDGHVGILIPVRGRMLLVLEISFGAGTITAIDAVADRETLGSMELKEFGGGSSAKE